ncbi:hypothetical protein [Terrarubrum flagellatum]|uniref:hypothetical protein n=1 Tax=Terrirubrum flagellatum TaxID=2895980 RepID=UPI00314538D3
MNAEPLLGFDGEKEWRRPAPERPSERICNVSPIKEQATALALDVVKMELGVRTAAENVIVKRRGWDRRMEIIRPDGKRYQAIDLRGA